MTPPLPRPPRKNPLRRTPQLNLPPGARGRVALGLTLAAAQGRFELQVCQDCAAVQYPPREACVHCLSPKLRYQPQTGAARLLAQTTLHHSNDLYFRDRLPWRLGLAQLDAGPTLVVHLHSDVPAPAAQGDALATQPRITVTARLDRAARAVLIALPDPETPHMADDPMLRDMASDPKFRKVLVTDAMTSTGQALIRALAAAGAELIWAGHAEPWKRHGSGLDDIADLPAVSLVPLDLSNARSVSALAAQIGGKVDIVINNAEVHRPYGIAARRGTDAARAEMDINYFGVVDDDVHLAADLRSQR